MTRLARVEAQQAVARVVGGPGVLYSRTSRGTAVEAMRRSGTDEAEPWPFRGEWSSTDAYNTNDVVTYGSDAMANADRITLYEAGIAAGVYIALKPVPAGTAPAGTTAYWKCILQFAGPGIGFKDPDQTNKIQVIVVHIPEGYGDAKFRKTDICLEEEDYDMYLLGTQARRKSDGVMREPTVDV